MITRTTPDRIAFLLAFEARLKLAAMEGRTQKRFDRCCHGGRDISPERRSIERWLRA